MPTSFYSFGQQLPSFYISFAFWRSVSKENRERSFLFIGDGLGRSWRHSRRRLLFLLSCEPGGFIPCRQRPWQSRLLIAKMWNQMKRLRTDTCRRKSRSTFRLNDCVFNGKPNSGVIPLHLFGHLPRFGERCTAEHGDNGCFHPPPGSLLTVYVNICLDGPTFPTFHFQVIVFFYEKCIMHKRLSEYYIVALAIWETSSPAALWKSSLQTGMICTAVVTPHQRTRRLNETLDPDPAGLLRSSLAAGGERGAFRGFAKESLHMLGKPRMWEDQCLCM